MFRTGLLSIIRSLVLYTQQQVYVIQVMLSARCNNASRWFLSYELRQKNDETLQLTSKQASNKQTNIKQTNYVHGTEFFRSWQVFQIQSIPTLYNYADKDLPPNPIL